MHKVITAQGGVYIISTMCVFMQGGKQSYQAQQPVLMEILYIE